jgi:hypothetical protein
MIYKTPQIVVLENAIDIIQGQTFKSVAPAETANITIETAPAYEADE